MKVQPALTAGELIEELKKLDPNLVVCTEGCDCDGQVGSVALQDGNAYLARTKWCQCDALCDNEEGGVCSCFCHKEASGGS
jgi:hypothetical protein